MENNHPHIEKLEYQHVTDGIYIGSNQCCQTHFNSELLKKGIEADISLEEVRVDAPFGVRFYIWLPVKKGMAPSDDQLKFGITILEKFIALKKKVYIHCENGHGRTSTLLAAYLIYKGKTVDAAIEFIKVKRSSVHLNQIQLTALKDFYNLTHKL